jgi:phage antirepressor YoqD-like protein
MVNKEKKDNVNSLIKNIGIVDEEFRNFLRMNDRLYRFRVDYSISYSASERSYKIEVFPSKNNPNFNSRQYFIDNFETEKGLEKLSRFIEENNIGIISY